MTMTVNAMDKFTGCKSLVLLMAIFCACLMVSVTGNVMKENMEDAAQHVKILFCNG
jgi:hypothetical protein